MTVSSGADLNIDQNRNDETRNVENFEGDFPVLRPKYDRQVHTHHLQIFLAFEGHFVLRKENEKYLFLTASLEISQISARFVTPNPNSFQYYVAQLLYWRSQKRKITLKWITSTVKFENYQNKRAEHKKAGMI